MQNYAKVLDEKVVEIKRNTKEAKPAGVNWKKLEYNKPNYNPNEEVLVIESYTIFEDKVVENYIKELINFEPTPIENEDLEERNIE